MGLFVLFGRDSGAGLLPIYLQVPWGETVPAGKRFDTVLEWGVPMREPEGAYILNPVKYQLRAKHAKSAQEIWKWNGLKTVAGTDWVREYQIAVFQQDTLGVWAKKRSPALIVAERPDRQGRRRRSPPPTAGITQGSDGPDGGGDFVELAPEDQDSFHVRRAKRDAVRALYALGLTFGLVRIGVDHEGQTVVIGADSAPKLDDRLAECFAEAINRYGAELEDAERKERWERGGTEAVLLGADPEFVLRRPDGHFVSASRFLEREGTVGCDAVVLSRSRVIHPLAELRPKPSPDPKELVRELRRTMRQAAKAIGDDSLAWLSGSMPGKGLPIGGHVHISGVWLNERLLRALDNYAALPLVLAEGVAAGQRRPRYGFLGDCRRKRHGGFEYRPLPSWLATPELALAVLATVRLIALHYRELPQRPLDRVDVQRAYYRGDKSELAPVVRALWSDLERLPAYGEYRDVLDAYRDRLYRMEGWDEQADFRIPWKIPPYQDNGSMAPSFVI